MKNKKLGPDFFVIGMQKAGTAWAYDSMKSHPNFFMPVVKEIHRYDSSEPEMNIMRSESRAIERANYKLLKARNPQKKKRLRKFVSYLEDGRRYKDYTKLFSCQKHLFSGDVTPAYSALDSDKISQIRDNHPNAKIILIIREPVSRLWSAFNMYVRMLLREDGLNSLDEANQQLFYDRATLENSKKYLALSGEATHLIFISAG